MDQTNETLELCRPIRLILSDVDGVLTDGGIIYSENGWEIKQFNARDGFGIRLWERTGGLFGIVTGRSSNVVKMRADELGAVVLRQGVKNKAEAVDQIAESLGIEPAQIAFIGDDFPDLPAMMRVGLPAAVADATDEIKRKAKWVSRYHGGHGAVRELIETILKAQNRWEAAIQFYLRPFIGEDADRW